MYIRRSIQKDLTQTMRNLFISVFVSFLAAVTLAPCALADYSQKRDVAARYYDAGDFKNAHKVYKELARQGDSFSQYRMSWMYLMGEGLKQDVIESVAWSVLAAQDRQQEKVAYMQTVAEMVPQDQRKKANKKISYYVRKWGNETESGSYKDDKICTGFRLCNHKTGAGDVGVPSNLWNASNASSHQELKIRAQDINDSILKSNQDEQTAAAAHEAS